MGPWSLLLIAALAITGSFGVDRTNFKTCELSGFCKRLRPVKFEKSPFSLNLDTVIVHGNVLTAEVFTLDSNKAPIWHYALRLSALVDGTFRIELDEANPLYPRYRTQLALDGEPKPDSLRLLSNAEGKLTFSNSQGEKVVITAEPLKLEFLDKNGDVAVVVNDNAKLIVEPLQQVTEKQEDNAVADDDEDKEKTGGGGETFKTHHDTKPRGNEAVSIDVSFIDADHVYGIPEHTDQFFLQTTTNGEPYRLYNLDVFEYELDNRMAIYGSVPVMYSHSPKRTSGVFWHNSAETWVDVVNHADANVVSSLVNLVTGSQQRRVDARFMSESGIVDLFVFLGPKPADAFRQYTKLTGTAPLPPKFSLAYHQSRWNYVDEADVRGVDENFDVHDIPADVIWLDIEYTDHKKYFTWDKEKFKNPAEMVANLTAKGRKLVVIIDPHIKREPDYFVHETATQKGYYVKDKDGNDFVGWCWPGSSSYLDFFNPAVSRYYAELYKFDNFPGTSKDVHFWNDMNEPSVFNGPEVTMHKDCRHYKDNNGGTGLAGFWEHRHVHNEYGLWQIRATHEGAIDRTKGKYRAFVLTRAVFAGTQRYAAVWTGDNAAEWGHLAVTVPMCLSLGVAGVSHCGADVGGFFKYPEAELMTRWYQAGAYQPFFRAHSHIETKRREPWLYEASTTALIRDAIRRRYALIDFWYTLFYEHTLNGSPIMRPLWQEFPLEKDTYTIDDQYLLGDKLLVRPVTAAGVSSVKVYLPGKEQGTLWYDADSYKAHAANGYFNQEVTISKIPVYQRGGSIVPRKERIRRSSHLMHDDPYTFVVALDASNSATGSLYIDDGESHDYLRNNQYVYAKITFEPNLMTYDVVNAGANYPTRTWLERIVIAGIKTPPKTAKLVQDDKETALQMTLHKGNNVLVVRKPAASMAKSWKITFSY